MKSVTPILGPELSPAHRPGLPPKVRPSSRVKEVRERRVPLVEIGGVTEMDSNIWSRVRAGVIRKMRSEESGTPLLA